MDNWVRDSMVATLDRKVASYIFIRVIWTRAEGKDDVAAFRLLWEARKTAMKEATSCNRWIELGGLRDAEYMERRTGA